MNKAICFFCVFFVGKAMGADLPEDWFNDWEKATAQASENEKPMFVVFSASWCGPCQSMVKNIYPKEEVREKLNAWIPVYIDVDKNEAVAAKYRATELPTLVYLNPDTTEINRTVGAVSSVEKMVELLETKGGAKYAGGATSLLAQGEITRLTNQIRTDRRNVELRKQRFNLILDNSIYKNSQPNLQLANQDYRFIIVNDRSAVQSMREDVAFLQTLTKIQKRPDYKEFYLSSFEQQHPKSRRLESIWVVSAKNALKKADYQNTVTYMKKYMARFPDGDFNDEYKLLLPQIEDFLELSKGVSFQ